MTLQKQARKSLRTTNGFFCRRQGYVNNAAYATLGIMMHSMMMAYILVSDGKKLGKPTTHLQEFAKLRKRCQYLCVAASDLYLKASRYYVESTMCTL